MTGFEVPVSQSRSFSWSSRLGWVCGLVLVSVFLAAGVGCKKEPEKPKSPLDRIPLKTAVVKVNGENIYGSWLRNWCATMELTVLRQGLPLQVDEYEMVKEGMRFLARMNLIAQEARRRGLTVTDAEIQDQLAKEMKLFESTEKWREKIEVSGMNEEQRRDQIRIQLLSEKYRDQIVRPDIAARHANDEQARKFYEKFKDTFKVPRSLHLRHLMRSVAKDAPSEEKAREKGIIEKARTRIIGGEAFDAVAREASTDVSAIKGGDVGWISEDMPFLPALREAILKLKVGEISPVLESRQGFHLFQIMEIKEAGQKKFEDVREQIKKQLLDEGMKLEMERTAKALWDQALASGKISFLDPKSFLGEPPPKSPEGSPAGPPGQAPAEKASPEKEPAN